LTVSDCDTGQAEGFITAACDFEDRVRAETVSNWLARPLISREGIATVSRDDVQEGGVLPRFGHLPEADGPKVRKGWEADLRPLGSQQKLEGPYASPRTSAFGAVG